VQLPHWYETLWFWLAFWTVVLAIGRKFYRDRMAYRNLMNSESKLRLQALQAQMNPHFIGNSIYAIQQFFYPPDPEKASEYIELFNRLLRQSMLMSEKHFVFFMEDLRYYLDYLTMLKLRFGERFSYEIEGQENLESNMPFPAMILQPIIENATIHGLAPKGVSKLKISFLNTNGVISCAIEDNGEGIDAVLEQKRRKNIQRESKGLEILFQRITTLNQLYNLDIQLNIVDLKQLDPQMHGTRAILSFHKDKFYNQPLITENRHEEN
jgi:LytS/YehU family sensor histidine kinase